MEWIGALFLEGPMQVVQRAMVSCAIVLVACATPAFAQGMANMVDHIHLAVPDQEQVGGPVEAEGMDGQGASVVVGTGDAGVAKAGSGVLEGDLEVQGVSPFRRAALSVSTMDWITASRSPSRTCIKLLDL